MVSKHFGKSLTLMISAMLTSALTPQACKTPGIF